MLKKTCVIIFSVLSICASCAEDNFSVGISTKRPLVGEVVTISLTADDKPELTSMPEIKNAEWLPGYSSTTMTSVNGEARYTKTYAFKVNKKGTIAIPELEVKFGRETRKISSLQIQAVDAGDQKVDDSEGGDVRIKDILFGKVEVLNLSKDFYVGEEISLEINLFKWQQIRVRPTSYPEIKLEKIVFRDYSRQNRQNTRFIIKRDSLVAINGKNFVKQSFETAFRTIASGTFKTMIKIQTEMSG